MQRPGARGGPEPRAAPDRARESNGPQLISQEWRKKVEKMSEATCGIRDDDDHHHEAEASGAGNEEAPDVEQAFDALPMGQVSAGACEVWGGHEVVHTSHDADSTRNVSPALVEAREVLNRSERRALVAKLALGRVAETAEALAMAFDESGKKQAGTKAKKKNKTKTEEEGRRSEPKGMFATT